MTKARVIAQYQITSSNVVDYQLQEVKFDFTGNVKDYGLITDATITATDDLGSVQ